VRCNNFDKLILYLIIANDHVKIITMLNRTCGMALSSFLELLQFPDFGNLWSGK